MKLISVDMDSECTKNVINICQKNKFENFEAITMKGEDYLKKYKQKIDYIYLDAFDFYHNNHPNKRKNYYKKNLNCEIRDNLCHKMHLECCQNMMNNLTEKSIICFNYILDKNSKKGKGVTAIPYLLKNNFEIIEYIPTVMILKKKYI